MSELESPQNPVELPPPHDPGQALPPYDVPPPPPRRKSRVGMFFFGAFSGCLLVVAAIMIFGLLFALAGEDTSEFNLAAAKVAIVPIEGEIVDSRDTIEMIHRYTENKTVRALVIRINSPGGAIAPSQEIYSAIRHARKTSGKPIVASFDSVAASGGFYIASACDRIVANPGSITGSIGVILQWFDMKDLVQWAKLKPETITSGALKDAGSPYRELTPAERQYFQSLVTQLHAQFVRDVAEGRKGKISAAEVAKLADGRVFTGEEALRLKLVDEIGSLDDAVRTAGKMGGIEGEPAKIWPRRREGSLLELLTSGDAEALLERVAARRIPQFLYRW